MINLALRAINKSIGQSRNSPTPPILPPNITSSPELVSSKHIVNLLTHTPALTLAESLIGKTHDTWAGQIALRFPGDGCFNPKDLVEKGAPILGEGFQKLLSNPLVNGVVQQIVGNEDDESPYRVPPQWTKHWHIDGFADKLRALPSGQVQNFTMLLGILLSDVPEEFSGNLTVYPGSHHLIENFFRQKGSVDKYLESSAFEALTTVVNTLNNDPRFPQPVQTKAKAGNFFSF